MNLLTEIVGAPGGGKTTSFRNLGPDTIIFNPEKKMLPFKDNGAIVVAVESIFDLFPNPSATKEFKKIGLINYAAQRPEIKNLVFDSFSSFTDKLMAHCRANFKNYEIYNQYNTYVYNLFELLQSIEGKYIFLTGHQEYITMDDGVSTKIAMAVKGNEHKGMIEKFATCVFYADPKAKEDRSGVAYEFVTNTDGVLPAKTPMGMFSNLRIPNDVAEIVKVYDEFYGYPCEAHAKAIADAAEKLRLKEEKAKAKAEPKPEETTDAPTEDKSVKGSEDESSKEEA